MTTTESVETAADRVDLEALEAYMGHAGMQLGRDDPLSQLRDLRDKDDPVVGEQHGAMDRLMEDLRQRAHDPFAIQKREPGEDHLLGEPHHGNIGHGYFDVRWEELGEVLG